MGVPLGKFVLTGIVSQGATPDVANASIGQSNCANRSADCLARSACGLVRRRPRLVDANLMLAPVRAGVEK